MGKKNIGATFFWLQMKTLSALSVSQGKNQAALSSSSSSYLVLFLAWHDSCCGKLLQLCLPLTFSHFVSESIAQFQHEHSTQQQIYSSIFCSWTSTHEGAPCTCIKTLQKSCKTAKTLNPLCIYCDLSGKCPPDHHIVGVSVHLHVLSWFHQPQANYHIKTSYLLFQWPFFMWTWVRQIQLGFLHLFYTCSWRPTDSVTALKETLQKHWRKTTAQCLLVTAAAPGCINKKITISVYRPFFQDNLGKLAWER